MRNLAFIDLFAGVGGFALAMKIASGGGAKCLFASEIDKFASQTYELNHSLRPFGDITKRETKGQIPSDFEILCGGFPCQAFSVAGYQRGFDDARGTLFFEILDIANRHKPKVLFLENVKILKITTMERLLGLLRTR